MDLPEEDQGLVEIVQTAGDIARNFHGNRITRKQREEQEKELIARVIAYAQHYRDYDQLYRPPSKSVFNQAINRYADQQLKGENSTFIKTIKRLMGEPIYEALEAYRREHYSQHRSQSACGYG